MSRFAPGREIVRRQFHRGELIGRVWVGRVVADDERGLAVWVPNGAVFQDIGAADGRTFREVPFGEWLETPKRLNQMNWRNSMLMLHPPASSAAGSDAAGEAAVASAAAGSGGSSGAAGSGGAGLGQWGDYSLWLFFGPDGAFRSWYVNLERPVARWDDGRLAGLDTLDYDLDIVAQPDRAWRWKDEDEFAYHLAHPDVYWCEDEQAVRAEGRRVAQLIETGAPPFDGSWTDFRPDPAWPVPAEIPAGWDRPRAW